MKGMNLKSVEPSGSKRGTLAVRVTKTQNGHRIKLSKEIIEKMSITEDYYGKDGKGLDVAFDEEAKKVVFIKEEIGYSRFRLSGNIQGESIIYSSDIGNIIENMIGKEIPLNKTIASKEVSFSTEEDEETFVIAQF